MSFGWGAGSEMNKKVKSLKRDRPDTLKKRSQFNKEEGKVVFEKKATAKQLKEISDRIQQENRKSTIQKIVFFVIFIALITYFIGFYK